MAKQLKCSLKVLLLLRYYYSDYNNIVITLIDLSSSSKKHLLSSRLTEEKRLRNIFYFDTFFLTSLMTTSHKYRPHTEGPSSMRFSRLFAGQDVHQLVQLLVSGTLDSCNENEKSETEWTGARSSPAGGKPSRTATGEDEC